MTDTLVDRSEMSLTDASATAGRTATANEAADSRQAVWFAVMVAALFVWVGLPWLAPLLMQLGWELPASWLY